LAAERRMKAVVYRGKDRGADGLKTAILTWGQ
jgi:hypothetical protein